MIWLILIIALIGMILTFDYDWGTTRERIFGEKIAKRFDRVLDSICITNIVIIFLAVTVALILLLVYPYQVTEKRLMYEEENAKIESRVRETVQAYMDYEQETYKNLVADKDLEVLLIKYPELNSNELVKSEIEIYKDNNNKIKELKEKEITKSLMSFWLKFNIGD